MKRVPQAGGIAFKWDGDRLLVLLVRAKKDPSIWIFPKGHIERGEGAADAAARETVEEAGVSGSTLGPVGAPLEFQSGREAVSVQYFAIRAESEADAEEPREKRWFEYAAALDALAFENARDLLRLVKPIADRNR